MSTGSLHGTAAGRSWSISFLTTTFTAHGSVPGRLGTGPAHRLGPGEGDEADQHKQCNRPAPTTRTPMTRHHPIAAPGDGRALRHARGQHRLAERPRSPARVADHQTWQQSSWVVRQTRHRVAQPRANVLGNVQRSTVARQLTRAPWQELQTATTSSRGSATSKRPLTRTLSRQRT